MQRYKNLFLVVIIIFLFIVWVRSLQVKFAKELAELYKQEEEIKQKEKILEKIRIEEGVLRSQEEKLIKGDIFSFRDIIESAALESGARISSLRDLESKGKEGYREMYVRIEVEGKYPELLQFIKSLEKNNAVYVNTLVVRTSKEDIYSLNLELLGLAKEEKRRKK